MSDLINRTKLQLNLNDWAFAEAPELQNNVAKEYTAYDMQRMIYRTILECMKAVDEQPSADASSDLISRQALRKAIYHEAFETDSEMQRWDSGCWIRYKLFEKVIDNLPSAERCKEEGKYERQQ